MAGIFISIAAIAVILLVRGSGGLRLLEFPAYDTLVSTTAGSDEQPRIALVTVTEEDIARLGEWPLTDLTINRIFGRLAAYGPRAIGLDIYRDRPIPPGTEALERTLLENRRIIAVKKFGSLDSPGVGPPPVLEGSQRIGFTDVVVDPDGAVRRGLLFLDDDSGVSFGFALRLAMVYLEDEGITPQPGEPDPSSIRLGDITLAPFDGNQGPYVAADPGGYQILLDYRDGASPFRTVTLTDLLNGDVAPAVFRDRVVIIGVSAESVKDVFFTPFSSDLRRNDTVPGEMVHAYITSQLLRSALDGDAPLQFMSQYLEIAWVVFWGALGCLTGLAVHFFLRLFALMFLGAAVILAATWGAYIGGWWLPAVPAGLSWLVTAGLVTIYLSGYERMQRRELMQLFSRHVSSDIADEIWRHRDQYLESGRLRSNRQTTTVMFTDIEHFTTVSEKLGPEVLMDWLNEYMEIMANLVSRHGGVVDDYHGDAIKADFGVPIMRTTDAEIRRDAANAVHCALEMAKALEDYNRLCKARGLPHLRMRVGISTGEVIAGCLGSSSRMKYTTIGDTVNTAARLETLDKESFDTDQESSDCRILISEFTLGLVEDLITARPVGSVVLRGKTTPVQVYRVDGDETQENVVLKVSEVMA